MLMGNSVKVKHKRKTDYLDLSQKMSQVVLCVLTVILSFPWSNAALPFFITLVRIFPRLW